MSKKELDMAKDFIIEEVKQNIDDWGKLNSKWIYPFAQMMESYSRKRLLEFDKYCESSTRSDTKLSSEEYIDKFLNI